MRSIKSYQALGSLTALFLMWGCSGSETLDGSWTFSAATCDGSDISTTYKDSASAITMNITEVSGTSTSGTETAEFSGCNRTTTLAFTSIETSTFSVARSSELCGGSCSSKCTGATTAISTAYSLSGSTMTWTQTSTASYCSNKSLVLTWTK